MIEAVVFDAYGTLFDVHSVMDACESFFPSFGHQISQLWRQKQLEYTWLRALMRKYVDFDTVNRDSLRYTLNHLQLTYDHTVIETLTRAYLSLTPYSEVVQALERFRTQRRAILSNGTPYMLQQLVEHGGLKSHLDEILSVDPLHTYKPDPEVYQQAVTALNVPKERILFVSSNGWDVAGSKAFGFRVGWINRDGKTLEELGLPPDYIVSNLVELANAVSS